MAENKEFKFTTLDMIDVLWRHSNAVETVSSFDRMQGVAFGHSISKILDRLYADDPDELQAAYRRHASFYNSNTPWCYVIHGIVIAMEEQKAAGNTDITDDSITNIKLGLMGPLAGVGDALHQGVLSTLTKAITIPLAYAGNIWAAMSQIFVTLEAYVFGFILIKQGYEKGKEFVLKLLNSGLIKTVINAASIVGVFTIGSLASSYVKLTTKVSWVTEYQTVNLQDKLDAVLPKLLPFSVIMILYYVFSKKGPKAAIKVMLITIVTCIVLSYLKIV